MTRDWLGMLNRGLRKPPGVIARRMFQILNEETERYRLPGRARRLNLGKLLRSLQTPDLDTLWKNLKSRPFPFFTSPAPAQEYERLCPGDRERILKAAEDAVEHRVDLLGSGPIELGEKIDWNKDYKSDISWPPKYCLDIDYANLDRPSDVKIPWEISRMQWMIPAGQAYLLTGEERYAEAVRDTLAHWIDANPCGQSVNWACTMEAAMRIFTWTWFFHVFSHSSAWSDTEFRERFLKSLYLHGDFTERHLEFSDINGNHYTADASGLVFAGLFFGRGKDADRWSQLGWRILCDEMPKQVYPDGVNFEASTAYHRLVFELFLFPAMYQKSCGSEVEIAYIERIKSMAKFTECYTRPDGTIPLWGDADDARALPFGGQYVNDHRYIPPLADMTLGGKGIKPIVPDVRAELLWIIGPKALDAAEDESRKVKTIRSCSGSCSFPDGGFYIMRNNEDHVFVDCGPVGLGGRGGHGHNDCLSFEVALAGVHLVTDCGAYLYTASCEDRNLFRSSGYHNTPVVDGEEQNRFIRPDWLWSVHYDAIPDVRLWKTGDQRDTFCGAHSGYKRLRAPVVPVRTIHLDHNAHALVILDSFEGEDEHEIEISMHLSPGVRAEILQEGRLRLTAKGKSFILTWESSESWELNSGCGRVSPSYGKMEPIQRLVWTNRGGLPSLVVSLFPESSQQPDILEWV